MTNLFQCGDFLLASGVKSKWKIECEALTPEDWEGLAAIAVEILPSFSEVYGVPRGGLPFADALQKYITPGVKTTLIAEDVITTGGSIERFRSEYRMSHHGIENDVIGVCAFARGLCPSWILPLFHLQLGK